MFHKRNMEENEKSLFLEIHCEILYSEFLSLPGKVLNIEFDIFFCETDRIS